MYLIPAMTFKIFLKVTKVNLHRGKWSSTEQECVFFNRKLRFFLKLLDIKL